MTYRMRRRWPGSPGRRRRTFTDFDRGHGSTSPHARERPGRPESTCCAASPRTAGRSSLHGLRGHGARPAIAHAQQNQEAIRPRSRKSDPATATRHKARHAVPLHGSSAAPLPSGGPGGHHGAPSELPVSGARAWSGPDPGRPLARPPPGACSIRTWPWDCEADRAGRRHAAGRRPRARSPCRHRILGGAGTLPVRLPDRKDDLRSRLR